MKLEVGKKYVDEYESILEYIGFSRNLDKHVFSGEHKTLITIKEGTLEYNRLKEHHEPRPDVEVVKDVLRHFNGDFNGSVDNLIKEAEDLLNRMKQGKE